jgi:hypothetical protein
MMPVRQRYNLGFTAASLRLELARIVADAYATTGDWEAAKEHVLRHNALQARSASSAVRMERELRQRLRTLTGEQLRMLTSAPSDSAMAMAWLSACKYSAFVFDFAAQVLRAKLDLLDPVLRPSDYEAFVTAQSLEHPELGELSPSTQAKIRTVLMTMLREVNILVPDRQGLLIQRPILPPDALAAILADDRRWLAGFLVPDAEIITLTPNPSPARGRGESRV